jgi:hypothetical protein
MLTIIGVDPGGLTGLAEWTRRSLVAVEVEACDAIGWVRERTLACLERNDQVEVGCERYTVDRNTHKKTRQSDATEITGQLRDLCANLHVTFSVAPPGIGKRVGDPETLRRVGLWTRGGKGHANDATRQVLVMLLKFHPDELDRILRRDIVDR